MNIVKTIGTTFALTLAGLSVAHADGHDFKARLSGFKEVPLAIFSPGTGKLRLRLNEDASRLDYELTYSGLTAEVTQAHIHFGKKHVAGGIIAFFCSNLGNAPSGTPACPQGEATVTGSIGPEGVVGPQEQNIPPGDFKALLAALFSNTAYANVHTTRFPAGEIRGEIRRKDDREEHNEERQDADNTTGQNMQTR